MAKAQKPETEVRSCDCPNADEVRAALARVTSQPPLAQSDRLSKFISYVVEEALAGRSDKIIGYTIGIDVFEKPESFDPTVDTIVRVEAGRLRRRLADYYREAGEQDRIEIVVPKGAYVPQFRYRSEPAPAQPTARDTPPDRGPSIAVLPFDNMGGNPDDQFFADGLTEETIANLARFKDLFVYSRSTTSKLTRDGADIRQLHKELGVAFVLEGSVRKSKEAVRVTIQLIDAATDGHILSERFDKPATPEGIFEIQDEIARLVAARVADRYGPLGRYVARARRPGQSTRLETYDWITRFYQYYATHDPKLHFEVREGLAHALTNDPGSSDGWAALSVICLDEYRFHINERPSHSALNEAMDHAMRGVVCDPENAFAYQAQAMAHFHRRDFSSFRVAAERAVSLNPGHSDVLADIGHCYAILGDWDRGLPLLNRAIELSPVHPGWYHHSPAWHHQMNGDPQSALDELTKAPMPGFFWHHAFLAAFHAELGNDDEVARNVQELLAIYPDFCDKVRHEVEVWCVHDALAKQMFSCWRNAGLEIE